MVIYEPLTSFFDSIRDFPRSFPAYALFETVPVALVVKAGNGIGTVSVCVSVTGEL